MSEASKDSEPTETVGSTNWITLGVVLLISLAVGAASGFVLGHQKGKSANAHEVDEARRCTSKAERTLGEREAELGKLKSDYGKASEEFQLKFAALQKSEQAAVLEVERQSANLKRAQDEKAEAAKKEKEAKAHAAPPIPGVKRGRPEDFTGRLGDGLDRAKLFVTQYDIPLEHSASYCKLTGSAEKSPDSSTMTRDEISRRLDQLNIQRDMQINATEYLILNPSAKQKLFFAGCYALEKALIECRDPDFDFAKLSSQEQDSIRTTLNVFKGGRLFGGLPHKCEADFAMGRLLVR